MPKANRSGQARILTPEQREDVWAELPDTHRLIAKICFYTASRITEVLRLERYCISNNQIVFRSPTTKTKTTKTVQIVKPLQQELSAFNLPASGFLFPAAKNAKKRQHKSWVWDESSCARVAVLRNAPGHLSRQGHSEILDTAYELVLGENHGASTHSWRRSFCNEMYAQHPEKVRAIMRISGHRSLDAFLRYISFGDKDLEAIYASIS